MKKIFLGCMLAAACFACGSGSEKSASDAKSAAPASSNPDYDKGLALVAKPENLCLTCHKVDEKLTGPAYREVANKYENNEANVKMLAEKVMKGGSGVWGEVAMPANARVSKEDAEQMVKYILLLRK